MAWRVIKYVRPNGKCPYDEFCAELNVKERARVTATTDLLATFGSRLTEPYAKKLKGTELWELRVRSGSNALRVFYGAQTEEGFLLLNGFRKKTDKTPPRELERAQRLFDEYKEANR